MPRRTRTPVLPAVMVGVVALAILVVNVGQAQLFAVITSVAVVVVYLAYLLVTVPLLVRRCQGWPVQRGTSAERAFRLGRWGVPVNAAAVLYGAAMVVNIAWPRGAVYDPAGSGQWYLRYFAELLVGATVTLSAVCFLRWRRGRRPDRVVFKDDELAGLATPAAVRPPG